MSLTKNLHKKSRGGFQNRPSQINLHSKAIIKNPLILLRVHSGDLIMLLANLALRNPPASNHQARPVRDCSEVFQRVVVQQDQIGAAACFNRAEIVGRLEADGRIALSTFSGFTLLD
ncbi:MAG TPA: hypothetical protein VFO63_12545 [Blastocatellia bacterium]|nr:hypothetical protein [Blastocatellia bacterium]